jgi:hypothetical protein
MKMSLRDNTSVDNSKAFGDRNGFVVNLDVDLNNQKDKLVNVHNIGSELLRFYKSVKMYYRFHCVA